MAQLATARQHRPVAFAPEAPVPAAASRRPRSAGWYLDPECRATTRFFDGEQWTEHTRGPAPLRSVANRAPSATVAETRCFASFENRPARGALVAGAISLLVNPLFVTSIVALVLGVVGLRRSGRSLSRHGRGRAAAGITLGLAGIVTGCIVAAVAIPLFLHAQQDARMAAVQAAIREDAANHGVHLASVTCPAAPPQPGLGFECRAATTERDRIRIEVLVPADGGSVQVAERAMPVPRPPRHPHHARR